MTYQLRFRRSGCLLGAEAIQARDDAHALLIAKTRNLGELVEVWSGAMRVGIVPLRHPPVETRA